jgi:hypothetical protein
MRTISLDIRPVVRADRNARPWHWEWHYVDGRSTK